MVYPKYERTLRFGEGKSSSNIKAKVALAARVLADGGILPTVFGQCSARVPGSNKIFIMPHFHWEGKIIQEITADDIVTMDLEGNALDCDSIDIAEERYFHTEIYKARPDVGSVIYGHPRMTYAFANAGRDTLSVFGSKVPLMPAPGFGSTSQTGQAVARALGEYRAVMWGISTHIGPAGTPTTSSGATVVVGRTIEEACVTAFRLEREAEMQLFIAILGGKPPVQSLLNAEQVASQIEVQTALMFPYIAAMDRGPRRETRGLLFWP